MSRILSDKEISGLLGDVIGDGEKQLINPNGIELRLGSEVKFPATGEKAKLTEGKYVKVAPGESLHFVSLEHLDFSREAVARHFPDCGLMAIITPTTTMMREAISHPTTKVDAGFSGRLNWSLRNSSHKDFLIGYGEPVFKLTFWLLQADEVPEYQYGEREKDTYQNTTGIASSRRRVPADLAKEDVVCSSIEKLDAKKQLREAGYPFNHIGSELVELHGKFELVSNDVRLLTDKIEMETTAVVKKVEETREWVAEHTELLFTRKFTWVIGCVVGAIAVLFGLLAFLQGLQIKAVVIAGIAVVLGVLILCVTWAIATRSK